MTVSAMPKSAPKNQRQKFIEAARKAEADESEEAFEANLKKIAKARSSEKPKGTK